MDRELFGVADHRPIHGSRFVEDAKFDERAELANHLQSLKHSCWATTSLDEDIAAIALGQIFHSLNSIILGDIGGVDSMLGSGQSGDRPL